MFNKKEELRDELVELFYRADYHFKESLSYLQASYHVACDLKRYEDHEIVDNLIVEVKEALKNESAEMNRRQQKLKTLLRDALGVEVGVEDYEGKSED